MIMPLSGVVAIFLLFISVAVGQENEVECLTSCGTSGTLLSVVSTVRECCIDMGGRAFDFPGAGLAIDCAPCAEYLSIPGAIGFTFTPESIGIGDPLMAECTVATSIGVNDPRARITWLGPDGTVFGDMQGIEFTEVTRDGNTQQEASLAINFPQFSVDDFGEYSCIAMITSDSVSGAETNVFGTLQIPSQVDISQFVVPVYPTPPPSNPVAGQPTSIDCIVSAAGLTNSDIQWVGPANTVISATSGRVSVGNVFQDQATGRSVRRLTFNPLSTEDSGPYTCVSSQGSSSQIITVNVPMPNTMVTTVPSTPVDGEPLEIDCSSAVPLELQGQVTVSLLGPDGSTVAQSTGSTDSTALFQIPRASFTDSGTYECQVTVTSQFLTRGGMSRPLTDSAEFNVSVPSPVVMVDECLTGEANCDVNAVCMDLTEGFFCVCQEGFTGSGVQGSCVDINECEPGANLCFSDEICRNTIGSFSCDPVQPTPSPSPDTPTPPSPDTPDTPSSPDTPTSPDTPDTPTSPDTPDTPTSPDTPDTPPLPILPSQCATPCHTNGECKQVSEGEFACVCKDGFQGVGDQCCINNILIRILREQRKEREEEQEDEEEASVAETKKKTKKTKERDEEEEEEDSVDETKKKAKGKTEGDKEDSMDETRKNTKKGERENEEEEEDSTTKKGKKRKKGKRRSRRSRRSRTSRRRCKTKKLRKSRKSCNREPEVASPPGYDLKLVSVPPECREILEMLVAA